MTKNTHLAAGVALSIAMIMPNELQSLAVCICGAAVGSTIPDVDVASSKPRKELSTIVGFSVAMVTALVVLENVLNIGLFQMIESHTALYRIILGYVTFILLCVFGTTTKHRTYTHSIVGLISFTGAMWVLFPDMTFPFFIGMLSHIWLDLLNTKKVRVLYPIKKFGIAFKLCHAEGKANKTICIISTLVIVVELIIFALNLMNVI